MKKAPIKEKNSDRKAAKKSLPKKIIKTTQKKTRAKPKKHLTNSFKRKKTALNNRKIKDGFGKNTLKFLYVYANFCMFEIIVTDFNLQNMVRLIY